MGLYDAETRARPRKIVRSRTKVALRGGKLFNGRSIDIGEDGMGILLDEALPVGQACAVLLETFANGQSHRFEAEARVAFCICSGTTGFRVGLQFQTLPPQGSTFIANLP
jgi:hypothetical protein